MAYTEEELKKELESQEYAYGFYTDIESETFPKGLNEDIVRAISKKKEEPTKSCLWLIQTKGFVLPIQVAAIVYLDSYDMMIRSHMC